MSAGAPGEVSPRTFPVGLRVAGRLAVVVGGGAVAARRIGRLLRAGARVRVVAPDLEAGLRDRAREGAVDHVARRYEEGDLAGAWIVVCASSDRGANARAAAEGRRRGALVNVADAPAASDFLVPAAVEAGPLEIAVGTSGIAPAAAARVRREIERAAPAWGRLTLVVARAREWMHDRAVDRASEKIERLAGGALLDAIQRAERAGAVRAVEEALGPLPEAVAWIDEVLP